MAGSCGVRLNAADLNARKLTPQPFSKMVCVQAGSYTNFFADALIAEAERDVRVLGIHAAMGGGTGMNRFEQRFPDRTFDVGIAEQVSTCGPQSAQFSLFQTAAATCRATSALAGYPQDPCFGWSRAACGSLFSAYSAECLTVKLANLISCCDPGCLHCCSMQ